MTYRHLILAIAFAFVGFGLLAACRTEPLRFGSTGPTLAEPNSMTSQFYDCETVTWATVQIDGGVDGGDAGTQTLSWTPTVSGKSFARAIQAGGAGTVKVDALGVGGSSGQTAQTFTLIAGQVLQLAVTKIYPDAGATGIMALY